MKDDEMQHRPRLHEREGNFYFRAKIPPDLLAHYPGREVKFSLKTRDPQRAWQLVQLESLRLDQEFAMHRVTHAQPTAALTVVTQIDDAFVTGACTAFLRDTLDNDIALRTGGYGDVEQEFRQEYQVEHVQMLRKALATGHTEIVDAILQVFLRSLGYELRVSENDYKRLAYAFLQAYLRGHQQIMLRDEGEIVEMALLAPVEKVLPAAPSVTWQEVFAKWRNATTRRPKTVDEFERVWAGLAKCLPGKPPALVTKKDLVRYRDHLQTLQQNQTVEKKVAILRAIFRLAVRDDLLTLDPTEGVTVVIAKAEKRPRTTFTTEELNTIFGSALFTSKPPEDAARYGGAAYWIPLIGLYTGARIEEIAQLRVSEIKHSEEHGGSYFELTDEGEGSKLKNSTSRRRVPVHARLIDAGLVEYANSLADPTGYLFPALQPDKYGRRSSGFSKFFNGYMRKSLSITDRRKVYHSFRHSFKHVCRELSIAEDIHDALTGHKNGTEARSYGNDSFPLEPLFRAIRSFRVRDLKPVPKYS